MFFALIGRGLAATASCASSSASSCTVKRGISSWSIDTVAKPVIQAQYAVRGEILTRALELEKTLRTDPSSLPFESVVKCNIGNPQALGQKPITFTRAVLAHALAPGVADANDSNPFHASDVVERAERYLSDARSLGAYSESQGLETVRNDVADFINARDEVARPERETRASDIFLLNGASHGVRLVLQTMIRGPDDAVLVPIPQYPLYSALIALLNGHFQGYFTSEDGSAWETPMSSIESAYEEAVSLGKTVRAMVVINPGNPTGSTLGRVEMERIVKFCLEKNIVLMADEVYQNNVYSDTTSFTSFKKVAVESDDAFHNLQLVSFHSISKGLSGECGLRGGYMDIFNVDAEVKAQIYKLSSVELCPNVPGQGRRRSHDESTQEG